MKLMTLFVLALSLAAAQPPGYPKTKEDGAVRWATSSALFRSAPYVQIGGLDQNGKPYLIVKGKRKPCSMRTLIKIVKASKMDIQTKAVALQYLGHPINVTINAPATIKEPNP